MDNITYSRFGREDLEMTSDDCLIKVWSREVGFRD